MGLAMFVRLRLLGRGLHENFLGWGLLGGVARSFLRGEGDHMSRAAVLRAHGAALGVHDDSFPATTKAAGFALKVNPHVWHAPTGQFMR